MSYKQIKDVLKPKFSGKTVELRGWLYRKRTHKDVVFLVLRDSSEIIQCVVKRDKVKAPIWKATQKITIESSFSVRGKIRKESRAPTGYELDISTLEIIGLADQYPIGRDLSEEFLLGVRHLWIRSRKVSTVLKVRSAVFGAIHEFCRKKGLYEFQAPILIAGGAESGPTLFGMKYYDKKVYLAQTWQLPAEAALPALEKIYTVIPAFRAEKSVTSRHLCEYWTTEVELAWVKLKGMTKFAEELLAHICQKVAKECKEELKLLGRDPKDLAAIKTPFPRITYTKALEILKKDGLKVPWGKDLRTIEERKLMKHYKKPLIVTHYPTEAMAFYKPADPKDPKTALCFDILAPEIGTEIVGGSERSLDIKYMKERLKKSGEKIKDYEQFFDSRRYGSVPHSGFGLGIERVIQWICKLDTIRDAIAFPRTPKRVT